MAIAGLPKIGSASPDEVAQVSAMAIPGSGAAEEIYRLYSQRVYRYIYWRVSEQVEDAEELTLDTFLNAITLSESFDGRSSVFVWLCGIAKLRVIDLHRNRSRVKRGWLNRIDLEDLDQAAAPLTNTRDSADQILGRISASQTMDSALLTLREDERESLLLQLVDGFSVREIAIHMGRSEDAVDSLTRRSKKKLRLALLQLMGEEVGT